jgi:SAM-dependent methyltransferase
VQQIGVVEPLDHRTYDAVYNGALFLNSTEYWRTDGSEGPMFYVVKEIIRAVKPRIMVSIGAGTAAYDAALLRISGHFVDRYVVIEPNPNYGQQIAQHLAGDIVGEVTLIEEAFGPSFDWKRLGDTRADLVMFAHSLYFIHSPEKAVVHGLRWLADGGKLLVHHQADDTSIRRGYEEFSKKLGLVWPADAPRQDHSMTTATISKGLSGLGIRHTVWQEPAAFIVDSFFNGDEETALLLLCFMMNTDVRRLPFGVVAALKQWVKDNSHLNVETNRHELPHPQGFLIVEPLAALP